MVLGYRQRGICAVILRMQNQMITSLIWRLFEKRREYLNFKSNEIILKEEDGSQQISVILPESDVKKNKNSWGPVYPCSASRLLHDEIC